MSVYQLSLPGGLIVRSDGYTMYDDPNMGMQSRAATPEEMAALNNYASQPSTQSGWAERDRQAAEDKDFDIGPWIDNAIIAGATGMIGAGAFNTLSGMLGGGIDMGGMSTFAQDIGTPSAATTSTPTFAGNVFGQNAYPGVLDSVPNAATSGGGTISSLLSNVPPGAGTALNTLTAGGGGADIIEQAGNFTGGAIPAAGAAAAGLAGSGGGAGAVQGATTGATAGIPSWLMSAAGPVVGALIQSGSASTAAGAQDAATQQAIGEQRRQYDTNRADLEPWRRTGGQAVNRLGDLMGISGNTGATGYGDLTKKFTLADFWDDPVTKASYQSGLDLGTKQLSNTAASRGTLNSGATLKALSRFGTDYTGNQAAGSQARFVGDQTNQYNRLAGIAGTGQTAATTTAGLGAGTANTIGNLISNQGNARGAAAIAGGNALSGALGTLSNNYNQQQTLNQLLASRGGYGSSYGGLDLSDPNLVYQN